MNYHISKYVPPKIISNESLNLKQLKNIAINKLKLSRYFKPSYLRNEDLISNIITIIGIYQTGTKHQQNLIDWELLRYSQYSSRPIKKLQMQEYKGFQDLENNEFVSYLLTESSLTSLEKFVIKSKFWGNASFSEIAAKTHQSPQNIHKIYTNTLTKFQNLVRQQL